MLFNSWEYAALLSLTVAIYWATPSVLFRQLCLLVASVLFYASWQPIFLLLMAVVVFSVFTLTILGQREKFGWAAVAAVAVPLIILAIFKYTNFAIGVFSDLSEAVGGGKWSSQFNIILPLGISFYTFQVISYVVDVRRGVFPLERNPLVFTLFVTFFPHLIAGPICRADQLIPQLRRQNTFSKEDFFHGILLFACGLFLKTALADNLSPYVNNAFDHPGSTQGLETLLAIVGFGIVILCDFWGYSTMAVGSAYLMGIKLPLNFNLPYAATSLQDFWRRWHMTLSNWLRDYLYIPLGGSRGGTVKTLRNLVITFVLGGLWHGAAYTFLIWGLIHGIWLAVERSFHHLASRLRVWAWLAPLGPVAGWVVTMTVVFTAWVFFRAESVSAAVQILEQLTKGASPDWGQVNQPLLFVGLFLLVSGPFHKFQFDQRWIAASWTVKCSVAFWLAIASLLLASGDVEEFIYFQF